MNKCFIITFLFFLFNINLYSQNTVIEGVAPGAELLKINLYTYADFISEMPAKISETKADSVGKFRFSIYLNQIMYAWIQIQNIKGDIYLEPGKTYYLTIDKFNFKEDIKESPFLTKYKLDINWINNDTSNINTVISNINKEYNDFILNYYNTLYVSRNKSVLDTLKKALNLITSNSNNFIKNYAKYKIATLEQSGNLKNKKKLFSEYIYNKPLLYSNIEYMYFFNQFYDKFFFNGNHNLKRDNLESFINREKNYNAILDSLGRDSLVKNEIIRELVFLKGMKELFYSKQFNSDNIIDILNRFLTKTKFKEHKAIAQNLIVDFKKLKPGTKAPSFKLKSINNGIYSLDNFLGKYTYISFITSWCAGCLPEMQVIKELEKKYGDKINFVTISGDKQEMNVYYYVQKNKYNWPFLLALSDYDVLEKYDVKTYPIFLLIDESGNIVDYPALKPSQGIEMRFKQLLSKNSF